jgi:hypothetical protein
VSKEPESDYYPCTPDCVLDRGGECKIKCDDNEYDYL